MMEMVVGMSPLKGRVLHQRTIKQFLGFGRKSACEDDALAEADAGTLEGRHQNTGDRTVWNWTQAGGFYISLFFNPRKTHLQSLLKNEPKLEVYPLYNCMLIFLTLKRRGWDFGGIRKFEIKTKSVE